MNRLSPALNERAALGGKSGSREELAKVLTGISGLDQVTGGGLPKGRATLVCGPAGCGKTLLAMEFLVRGITEFDESGVFVAFEETADDLATNVRSLGFDLAQLASDGKLVIDHIDAAPSETDETGDWDLDGLFLRLGAAIDAVGARRVVIDTLETLFGVFSDTDTLRSELRRLFSWLKSRGVTSVITGERGEGKLTRQGIEEYVSDCVIVLDHRVTDQTSTRRLRILKYRGSLHGTNEYPFLISASGISVLPVTSNSLHRSVSTARVSTGLSRLDVMLDGGGFYKGSAVLVSGTGGTGKSTLAAQFCDATCKSGGRVMYFAFEESEEEIIRNMSSVGVNLKQWVDAGLLVFHCFRPGLLGLEEHLITVQNLVSEFNPSVVIKDPISSLLRVGTGADVFSLITRQVDFLKARGVTTLFTSLNTDSGLGHSDQDLASLVDTWLLVQSVVGNGEHNRIMYVLKSRGMAHSNQIREFLLTNQGIELVDVYVGPQGVLTGSARQAQEAQEHAHSVARADDFEHRRGSLERRRQSVQAQAAALWRDFEEDADTVDRQERNASIGVEDLAEQRVKQGKLRMEDFRESESNSHAHSSAR